MNPENPSITCSRLTLEGARRSAVLRFLKHGEPYAICSPYSPAYDFLVTPASLVAILGIEDRVCEVVGLDA